MSLATASTSSILNIAGVEPMPGPNLLPGLIISKLLPVMSLGIYSAATGAKSYHCNYSGDTDDNTENRKKRSQDIAFDFT